MRSDFKTLIQQFSKQLESKDFLEFDGGPIKTSECPIEFIYKIAGGELVVKTFRITAVERELLTKHKQQFIAWLRICN